MTLHDLIQKYKWSEIKPVLLKTYPDQNPLGYEHVVSVLKTLTPVKSDMTISVSVVTDPYDNTDYIDVSGNKEGDDLSYALEFTSWDEWLGMEIKKQGFDDAEILVHCLWEMTFVGFTQEKIKERSDKLQMYYEDAIGKGCCSE